MERIFKFTILAALLALGWKYGSDFLPSGGGEPVGEGPGSACVVAAKQARKAFSGKSAFRSGTSTSQVADRVSRARGDCSCSSEACNLANEALDLLESTASGPVDTSQIGKAAMDTAKQLKEVDRLLDRAARAVGR